MEKQKKTRSEKDSSIDHVIEQLRGQLDTLKNFLGVQPSGSTLVDFDIATEELISEVFGSASPMVDAYEYAQIGEAAGMVNLPEAAPESVTHATEQASLRQRLRVLEMCIGELETRRAAMAKGKRITTETGPRVADYMSRAVHCVHVDSTLKEVALLLEKEKVGSLLVKGVDNFIGSITATELSQEVVAGGVDPNTTRVKTCMREPIITIESSDPIVEAVRLMKEKGTRHLAVSESGHTVGIISVSDILRYYSGVI